MNTDWLHMIKNLLIVVLVLLLMFLGNCKGDTEPQDIKVEHYTDTTYVTYVDTIEFIRDTTITKTVLSYTYVNKIVEDSSKLYTFTTHVSDSLITGDIVTDVKVKDSTAKLINQSISYVPKFPKYIYETETITIHDSVVVTKNNTNMGFVLGGDILFGNANKQGALIPKIGLEFQDKYIVEGGYDPFNKQIIAGFKYKFKSK